MQVPREMEKPKLKIHMAVRDCLPLPVKKTEEEEMWQPQTTQREGDGYVTARRDQQKIAASIRNDFLATSNRKSLFLSGKA